MLRALNELHDYTIGATDGHIGNVKDLYVDDQDWVVRYLVVETGSWLMGRKVLISPIAIGKADWENRQLPVSVTTEQVKNSPGYESEKTVTRQHETDYAGYYGYPLYWGSTGYWGGGMYPNMLLSPYGGYATQQAREQQDRDTAALNETQGDDLHLRSCTAMTGYHLHATDGDIGHVCGMLVDDETWAVRYLIVNTSNWWVGHQMLIAPNWIESVNWQDSSVSVNLTRQAIKEAPAYQPGELLTRADESRLHEHYGRAGYWENDTRRAAEMPRR
ncbi:MAG: PRC-barrel domain-containing protein [Rhodoferax sp.]|uniref:PRC-barrel domain-containing protein n=2 Tax=Rhodoferax sp. TaxID=50421 RepID=UPI003266F727